MKNILFLSLFLLTVSFGFAQGPGGVSLSSNSAWYSADYGVTIDASNDVVKWENRMGIANMDMIGVGSNKPAYETSAINGFPTISFNDDLLESSGYLSADYFPSVNEATMIIVTKADDTGQQSVIYGTYPQATNRFSGHLPWSNRYYFDFGTCCGGGQRLTDTYANVSAVAGTYYIWGATFNGSGRKSYLDNSEIKSTTLTGTFTGHAIKKFQLGGEGEDPYGQEGDIAEFILYKDDLNEAQRVIINNYLSAKYNLTIAADYYADATYFYDVIGIGTNDGTLKHTASVNGSAGLGLAESNTSLDASTEYIFAGHDNTTNAVVETLLGAGVEERWEKDWTIDKTGTIDAQISFDFSEGINGLYPQISADYELLKWGGATYDIVTSASKSISGDKIIFDVIDANLTDGLYTLGTTDKSTSPVFGKSLRTWYSYQSGNWNDPNTWTLDGGVTPIYDNASSEIPSADEKVSITSGRKVTIQPATNNLTVTEINVVGELDLTTSTGHDFNKITGDGVIITSATTDNFPDGDVTSFVDTSIGGTFKIDGSDITLDADREFNNIEIDLVLATDVVTLVADYDINGTLTITNGVLQINDNSNTAQINLTLEDLVVDTNGEITVGTASTIGTFSIPGNLPTVGNYAAIFHRVNIYGDFTNNGSVRFTNQTVPDYSQYYSGGAASVYFKGNDGKVATLNGVTDFYNIIIDKGSDKSYVFEINSASTSNFGLYGANYASWNTTSPYSSENPEIRKALWIKNGTLKLTGTLNIPTLVEGSSVTNGDYLIPQNGALWIAGSGVSVRCTAITTDTDVIGHTGVTNTTGWMAFDVLGKFRISDGSLDVGNADGGFAYWTTSFAEILIEGGTVTSPWFKNIGGGNSSYTQTGGTFLLTGENSNGDFSLDNANATFNMSGGEIILDEGDLLIGSDPGNFSVTGGLVTFNMSGDATINSTANLWDLETQVQSGTRTLTLGTDLTVSNDLTIGASSFLNTSGSNYNLNIGADFTIAAAGGYTSNSNTTTIDGTKISNLDFGGLVTLNDFTINKDDESQLVEIDNGAATAIQIDGAFRLESGTLDYKSFAVNAKGSLHIADTLGVAGQTGQLLLDAGSLQTMTATNGVIGNMEIDNTNGIDLTSGDVSIFGSLTMTNGVFDINTSKLTMAGASATITGTFSSTVMIQTAGNASDGGLEMYVDANETITFPIGTDANADVRYTPLVAVYSSFNDDGYIRVSPSDAVLATTDGTGGTMLSYYWHVLHQGFGTVPKVTSYTFSGSENDDGTGSGATFPGSWRAGKVLSEVPYTRSREDNTSINNPTGHDINFDGDGTPFDVENANYSAGPSNRFNGAPGIYYSRRHGSGGGGLTWTDTNDWSTTGHDGAAAGSFPGTGDIVVIGAGTVEDLGDVVNDAGFETGQENSRHQMVAQASRDVGQVVFNSNPAATVIGNNLSRIRLSQTTRDLTAGTISGHGELMVAVSSTDESVITGDMGDFISNSSSSIFYDIRSGGTVSISNLTEFPGIRFFGNNNNPDVSFANDISAASFLIDNTSNLEIRSNMTVTGSVQVGNNGVGHITFPNDGANNTLSIGTDLLYNSNTANTLTTENAGSDIHTLSVSGNITLTTATTFDLSSAGTNTILELTGTGNHFFTNSSTANPDFYQIEMDKGTDQSNTFNFDDDFTISIPTASIQPIDLQNGTLIINDAAIGAGDDLVLTNATNNTSFNIPSTAALQISAGKAVLTGTDIGIALDGLLQIDGTGELDMSGGSNNFIEYSASGNATIIIDAGTLTVGSQIRRSTIGTTGVLNYSQTGGTVVVGKESAPEETRGVFEVLNTGSDMTLTGGDFTLVRQNGTTPTIAALYLDPESSDYTGSTITIGSTDTPVSQSEFNLNISPTINNIVFAGSNTPTSKLDVRALVVGGNITINAGHTFDASGFDLSLTSDFTNNGTYTANGNTTTFSGTASQNYSGSGTETFYDVVKDNTSVFTASKAITITNDLTLSAGTFSTGANTITLQGNAEIDIDVSSTSGNGLVLQGASEQFLSRSVSGTNTIDILTIDNGLGVTIPPFGYDFTIDDNLRLSSGKLNVGNNLLTLSGSCDIEEVNTFSDVNMIQTNSSFADNGVLKLFPAISSSTNFIFPVGESIYTPVEYIITNMDQGEISVRPANEMHISIIEDSEAPDPEIVDADNALQYHWVVGSSDIASLTGTATFTYDASDALVTAPYALANYIPAILLDATTAWDKGYGTADFDEGANTFTITMLGVDDTGIAGVYTAGVGVDGSDNPINGAIPDVITLHETLGTSIVGDYDNAGTWTTSIPAGGPIGGQITIKTGDELVLNNNNVRLSRTVIESGATLTVDETTQHRLGTVSGTGTLKITSSTANAIFPAGDYAAFFSCSGGGLEYAGTGSYSIMSGLASIRNLTLSGSGDRNLANNNCTICENLILNGPDLRNVNNRTITINGVTTLTSGGFYTGTGLMRFNGNLIINGGSYLGENGGNDLFQGQVQIDAGLMSLGTGGNYRFQGDLIFNAGTFDGGSGWATMKLEGATNQTISGDFTGTSNIYRLQLNNAAGITKTNGDIEIDAYIIFSEGIFDLNLNTMDFDNSAFVHSSGLDNSTSFINGKVTKVINSVGGNFTFPIGKNGRWGPASVKNVSIGGETWDAEYFYASPTTHADVDNITPIAPILRISNNEYWIITDGNVGSIGMTATVGLSWDGGSDVSPVSGEREQLEVMVWNDGASSWDEYGGGTFSGGHTQSAGSFQSSSAIGFSKNILTLGSTNLLNALPIELLSFKAEALANTVKLTWETASELNNDYFTVLRSKDGENFEEITTILGAGNSNEVLAYSFIDERPFNGLSYYKLMQTDFDGLSSESDIVLVKMLNNSQELKLISYPNPFRDQDIAVSISGLNDEEKVSIAVFDMFGKQQLLISKKANSSGYLDIIIEEASNWNSGIYIIMALTEKGAVQAKVIKQ